jgi:COP9 signalosome complex subunit 3
LYYYYGGVCYAALKKWEKAIQFFETVITAPAQIASAIMIEAYKKYILVSLIHKGEVGSLPKYVVQPVIRQFKQFSAPYDYLATSFSTRSVQDLTTTIERNLETFAKDNHLGLVGQVKSALILQKIQRFSQVYITTSFMGIQENMGIVCGQAEIEGRIMKIVETSPFAVKINQQKRYVLFENDGESYDNDETASYLTRHIASLIHVHKQMAFVDRMIETDEKYLQKISKADIPGGRAAEGQKMYGFGQPDSAFYHDAMENNAMDEDLSPWLHHM